MLGKPLLAYTIEAALVSGLFERVIVSTDDQEIAKVAEQYGSEVPFLRDRELADDFTPVSVVTLDALVKMDANQALYQNVCQLMPNCPLRNALDVKASLEQFVEANADSQISVSRFGWLNPWWAATMDDRHVLEPIFQSSWCSRSQDLPVLFCPNGSVWWMKAEILRREKTFHIERRTGWEIPWQRGVDIDTEEDWKIAELIMVASRKGFEQLL
jgi:N-acylneuraminate cytidylyltransferase